MPELAVKTADVSAQNTKGLVVEMVAVGFETAIVMEDEALEVPAVAVQVYVVVAAVGDTVRVFPIVPSFQTYPTAKGLYMAVGNVVPANVPT